MAAALKALPPGVRVGVGVGVAWGATGGATGWSGSAHSNLGARTRAAGPVAAAVSRAALADYAAIDGEQLRQDLRHFLRAVVRGMCGRECVGGREGVSSNLLNI